MPFDTNIRNTLIFLPLPHPPQTPPTPPRIPQRHHPPNPPPNPPNLRLLSTRLLLPCPITATRYQSEPARNGLDPKTIHWTQKQFTLPSQGRGSHLITPNILSHLPELKTYKTGLLHLFLQHTSCALSLNENYDSDVRADMSDALDRIAPEDPKGEVYRHSAEGLDDMPAHVKSSLVGASVSVPIRDGKLALGTWQGVWFLEFREGRQSRKVVATMQGEKK
ncbi:hypothetical protein LTR33_011681 [Friedmanniomyces endolithicus]|nr:hypothetical protein LTR33_011681 [Friedmanniomyces endolithicus]